MNKRRCGRLPGSRLSDGRVLIAVGAWTSSGGDPSAEIYNPKTGTFTATGSKSSTPRELRFQQGRWSGWSSAGQPRLLLSGYIRARWPTMKSAR
jgi:hypothetical protein